MFKLKIAGILIEIFGDRQRLHADFDAFETRCLQSPDISIKINRVKKINKLEDAVLLDEEIKWYKSATTGHFNVVFSDKFSGSINVLLESSEEWSEAAAVYKQSDKVTECAYVKSLLEVLFRNFLLLKQGLIIHAAAIEWQRKGILFAAPSGTGKTTQANLWSNIMGATVLNGDRPAVRIQEGTSIIYGTPWSGLTPAFINASVPLSAVVILEQALENNIIRLEKGYAVSRLLPRCFLPYYSVDLMNRAIDNLEAIIGSTPVYLLKCKPDIEAVKLVHKCLK